MKGKDYREKDVSVSSARLAMAGGAMIKYEFRPCLDSMSVQIRERNDHCLVSNGHEPRKWIVCWSSGGSLANITLHATLGGAKGALVKAGLLYGKIVEHLIRKETS